MTRVCLVGAADANLRYELLSRETSREALSTYDLREPFENAVGLETVSLGAAVSVLNDLDWYLVRFVDEAMVLEPSVDDAEWLSRSLATAVRDGDVDPDASGRYCKVYGLEPTDGSTDDGSVDAPTDDGSADGTAEGTRASDSSDDSRQREGASDPTYRLVEPMYVTRTGDGLPTYDLRDVSETLVERVTESEFGA